MAKSYKLRSFNIFMGFFHLLQGILMLVLSSDFALPVTTNYLKFDVASLSLKPFADQVFELPIGPMVALFLFMSATAHFIISIPAVYPWYIKNIKKGMNPARWYEYAFSSSVMIVVISMLVGVYDLSTLILVFFINMMMICLDT